MKFKNIPRYIDGLEDKLGENYRLKAARVKFTKAVWYVVRLLLLLGLSFIMLYPLMYMLSMAFRVQSEVLDPTIIWIPKTFTLDNIKYVIDIMKYGKAVLQTLEISIGSSFIQIVSCCLTGYGFARFKFPGKNILFGIVLFSIVVPPQTLLIPTYLMNVHFDFFFIGGYALKLINFIFRSNIPTNATVYGTAWSFYLPAVFASGIRSGLIIFIFRQFFSGMPKELEESAYIDGAGPLKTFIRIMVPNAAPAFITVFLFSTVWYWSDYFYAGSMLTDLATTVSVKLSQLSPLLTNLNGFQYDPVKFIVYMQSGCLLVITPPLALFVIFQRYFVESIERSGIVG